MRIELVVPPLSALLSGPTGHGRDGRPPPRASAWTSLVSSASWPPTKGRCPTSAPRGAGSSSAPLDLLKVGRVAVAAFVGVAGGGRAARRAGPDAAVARREARLGYGRRRGLYRWGFGLTSALTGPGRPCRGGFHVAGRPRARLQMSCTSWGALPQRARSS